MSNPYRQTLDNIIFLYEQYSKEHRATTQPFHLERTKKFIKDYEYQCEDLIIREPLIEHTGSLPIVATTIFPHLDDPNVDLGCALIMLAIHDIGELVTGDEITFTKKKTGKAEEKTQALKMLHKSYHEIYLEMEEQKSDTARFAKAVDKMTPDIVDLMTPAEITVIRYQQFVHIKPQEIVPMIKTHKHPYMLWNSFMTKLHLEILQQIDKKLEPFY